MEGINEKQESEQKKDEDKRKEKEKESMKENRESVNAKRQNSYFPFFSFPSIFFLLVLSEYSFLSFAFIPPES